MAGDRPCFATEYATMQQVYSVGVDRVKALGIVKQAGEMLAKA